MSTPAAATTPSTSRPKTVLAPCMGVGKIVANVTRRAAYLIKDQCPEDVELLSFPALLAGDPHERALVQNHPSIIIDGCALRCAAHIYQLYGVEAVAKIEVNQVMKEKKIGPGKTRKELELVGKRLSDFTAERVLTALRDEGLSADFVPPNDLQQSAPESACGCPYRSLADTSTPEQARAAATHAANAAALAEAASAGVCQTGPAGEQTASGKYKVNAVTVIPCQGIKRTGGRITQRAAYDVVEDRFLGKSQVLCISALAAGVQEDVDMLENFPSVAVNGCGLRCASVAAEHHGVPAVAHVDLQTIDPQYPGDSFCLEPELTPVETLEATKLADAVAVEVDKLLGKEIEWQKSKVNLHGLIHQPGTINAQTGYADGGQGILIKLAKAQAQKAAAAAAPPALAAGPVAPVVPVTAPAAEKVAHEVAGAQANCEYPGLKSVVPSLFKPKPRAPDVSKNGKQPS